MRKCKKWVFVLSLLLNALAVVVFLLIVAFYLEHFRPLHPTWRWQVNASSDGMPYPMKICKELGRDVFFLSWGCLEEGPDLSGENYWAFVMDFSRKDKDVVVWARPSTVTVAGLNLVIGRDYGTDIMGGELAHVSYLTYSNKSVVFSNGPDSVSAIRRGLFSRKTAEVHLHTGDNLCTY